ncbi:unnamed protein product [Polarella glacialis]|uniref:Uncharacterized protein n=1 Tax=Polarella glacialis TaxID=89957 RepID=A0A813FND6_POLGL|nr:unnamed protein product [Polarella glacialis]
MAAVAENRLIAVLILITVCILLFERSFLLDSASRTPAQSDNPEKSVSCAKIRALAASEHNTMLELEAKKADLDASWKVADQKLSVASGGADIRGAKAKEETLKTETREVLASEKVQKLESVNKELMSRLETARRATSSAILPYKVATNVRPAMVPEWESRVPEGLVLGPSYRRDPEGVYFYELDLLTALKANGSLINLEPSNLESGITGRYGSQFKHVVTIDPFDQIALDLEWRTERFDMALVSTVMKHLTTDTAKRLLVSLRGLLKDDGIGVIASTHVEEGARYFTSSFGSRVEESSFNLHANLQSLGKVKAFNKYPVRYWTKNELQSLIEESGLTVVDYAQFSYNTPKHAIQMWRLDTALRPLLHIRDTPSSQMFVVQLAKPSHPEAVEPSNPNARIAVMALLKGGATLGDYQDFLQSRKCLRDAWGVSHLNLSLDSWDEVVFHEGGIPETVQKEIQKVLRNVIFVDVHRWGGFDPSVEHMKDTLQVPVDSAFEVGGHHPDTGYHHMCRFFARQWMHALRKYDYAMRVDQDVCIETIGDVYSTMQSNNAVFGYVLFTVEEHQRTVLTLQAWLEYYMFSRGIRPRKEPVDAEQVYFTNLFVTNVSWWFQDEVQRFLDAIDRSGGIYAHGWGDAPIQTAALHMFAKPETLLHVQMDYSHGSKNAKAEDSRISLEHAPQ